MNYLPASDMAILHTELQAAKYSGLTDTQRFDFVHSPEGTVANPTAQGTIAGPLTMAGIMTLLSDANNNSAVKLAAWTNLGLVKDAVDLKDRASLLLWTAVLPGVGLISSAEATAIHNYILATIPDPIWTATVPGPTPKARLFGNKTWTGADGSTVNFIPPADVGLAR